MRNFYHLVLFLLLGMYSNAQVPTLEWAGQIEIDPFGYSHAIATDANGNVYTVGYFEGTADFDPGQGTLNYTSTTEVSYIQKLNAAGGLIWTKFLSGTSTVRANDIALDTNANIYITGSYKGDADFDPGAGTAIGVSTGANTYDPFIVKLDSNGDYLWSRVLMYGAEDIEANSITVGTNGDAYVTGYYRGSPYYEIGITPYFSTSNGNSDVFIFKLDSFGNVENGWVLGGTGWDYGTSISVDENENIYAVGHAAGTVDFDPWSGVYNLTSTGQSAVYILKLDALGTFDWAKNLTGSTAQDYTNSCKSVIDENNNLYLTGFLSGTIDFDPNAGVTELTSQVNGNVFVEKIDSSGNMIWVNAIAADYSNSIDIDANRAPYITGMFTGTTDFDPSAATFELTSAGSADIFVQKMNTNGNFAWAQHMGGLDYDWGQAITLDSNSDILMTGGFNSTADFDPGTGTMNFTSVGSNEDIFVLKLDNCLPVTSALTISNCFSYTTPSGNNTYTTSGIYNDTLVNQCGADSIITIDLTISTVDVSVTNTDPMLTAVANGATYQWIECPAMTEINGATNQSYTPGVNGDYAVIVTENGCSDTSSCYSVASVNVDELNWNDQILIYPNPTNQKATIDLGKVYEEVEIQVVNQLGQAIFIQQFESTESINVELNEERGVYFFIIQTQDSRVVRKVIKK